MMDLYVCLSVTYQLTCFFTLGCNVNVLLNKALKTQGQVSSGNIVDLQFNFSNHFSLQPVCTRGSAARTYCCP